jgi:pimeloyl-ACP methyl ester carboxylesterase
MKLRHRGLRRAAVSIAIVIALACALSASPASATDARRGQRCHDCDEVQFVWMRGFRDPATPDRFNRVGVLKVGPESAHNVLVLNPGTSAGAGYFFPLAKDIVRKTHGQWQVWSVERRENLLEDQSVLDLAKHHKITGQQLADYYLGWLANPSVTKHFQLIPDSAVGFARGWGLNVEIEDLHRVVEAAHDEHRRVVLGGHSLGGAITTAYATWDFRGKAGAKDLAGLVFIDGASFPSATTAQQATQSLQNLQTGSPWLSFGGIPAPYLGLFSAVGSTLAVIEPNAPSIGQVFPFLPANLKPPVRATNEAQFGYAVSVGTSPPNLLAAQVHAGRLASSGTPRGWDRAGAITPIQRWANMLSGTGLTGMDGSAWYHPMRLSIDAGAVANGNANPAQSILDVKATHGRDLDKHTLIYAFGAALGGQRVLDATRALAHQSGISDDELTLVNRQATYAHNDPNAASPENDFLDNLIPFLAEVAGASD